MKVAVLDGLKARFRTCRAILVLAGTPLRPIRVVAAGTGDPEALAVSPSGRMLSAANQVTATVVMIPAPPPGR